jgi:hypothetical protein
LKDIDHDIVIREPRPPGIKHMRKFILVFAASLFSGASIVAPASASPLDLTYSVIPEPSGLFKYDFTLTLTNSDGSWAPGQAWGWIVFGDGPSADSPLADWTGLTVSAPFFGFGWSGGGHNGPTLEDVLIWWVPTGIGESLDWSGTSSANLAQGDLLFTTALVGNGARAADFQVADLAVVRTVSEPSSLLLMLAATIWFVSLHVAERCRRWRAS